MLAVVESATDKALMAWLKSREAESIAGKRATAIAATIAASNAYSIRSWPLKSIHSEKNLGIAKCVILFLKSDSTRPSANDPTARSYQDWY